MKLYQRHLVPNLNLLLHLGACDCARINDFTIIIIIVIIIIIISNIITISNFRFTQTRLLPKSSTGFFICDFIININI